MRADPGTNGAGEEKVQPPAAETSDSAERRFQDLEQQAADAQLQLSRIEGLLMRLCAPTLVSAGQAAGAAVEGYDVATAAAVGGVAGSDQTGAFRDTSASATDTGGGARARQSAAPRPVPTLIHTVLPGGSASAQGAQGGGSSPHGSTAERFELERETAHYMPEDDLVINGKQLHVGFELYPVTSGRLTSTPTTTSTSPQVDSVEESTRAPPLHSNAPAAPAVCSTAASRTHTSAVLPVVIHRGRSRKSYHRDDEEPSGSASTRWEVEPLQHSRRPDADGRPLEGL